MYKKSETLLYMDTAPSVPAEHMILGVRSLQTLNIAVPAVLKQRSPKLQVRALAPASFWDVGCLLAGLWLLPASGMAMPAAAVTAGGLPAVT